MILLSQFSLCLHYNEEHLHFPGLDLRNHICVSNTETKLGEMVSDDPPNHMLQLYRENVL